MTTPIRPLLPLVSTGCGCCAPATPSGTTSATPVDENAATPSPVAIFQVEGMTCGHCTSHVTDAVSAVPQVDNVHIDLRVGGISTVTVTGTASPEDVGQVIDDAGYTVLSS